MKYRYFADLRTGAWIYVTVDGIGWPPEGYPLVELSEDDVKILMHGDEDGSVSS